MLLYIVNRFLSQTFGDSICVIELWSFVEPEASDRACLETFMPENYHSNAARASGMYSPHIHGEIKIHLSADNLITISASILVVVWMWQGNIFLLV